MIDVYIINLTAVGIFGMILSAVFCDIRWTWKKNVVLIGALALILVFQGIIYFRVDPDLVESIYPLITHIPLIGVLCVLSGEYLWPIIAVLTAYLCCQLRRWLALLITAVFSGGFVMQNTAELILTLPILLIIVYLVAPSVRSISHYPVSVKCQFGMVPALYYGFDYLTRIYTSLLQEGRLVAIEFMPFVCSVAYLIFVTYTSAEGRIRNQLERTQDILNLQVEQAAREIRALRESQEKTSLYRHDMRHHMQYLSSCIEDGRLKQAQEYIRKIYREIETNKVAVFCKNEAANLIFSAFAKRAEDCGILMQVEAAISQPVAVDESDLCVLLSNALENALHACQKQREKGQPGVIEVTVYEKGERLFLQIINSCSEEIAFDHGIPVTSSPGHGIGVRSICAIVERYDGIYSFSEKDKQFILRISL